MNALQRNDMAADAVLANDKQVWKMPASGGEAIQVTRDGGWAPLESPDGIYGVLAYLVAQRRREIAIRMALGSTGAAVVKLVLRQGLTLVAVGLTAGFAGAAGLQKVIANQIYGVRPLDPLVIGGVTVLLGMIALLACAMPAWGAAHVDPVTVLKEE